MRHARKPSRLWLTWPLALVLALAGVHCPCAPAGEPFSYNPVAELRLILQSPVRDTGPSSRDLELRQRLLRQQVDRLSQLPELRQALLLQEWRDDDPEESVAAVDRAARVEVTRRFEAIVHRILQDGAPAARLAAVNLLAAVAADIPGGIQGWTLGNLGPDLAELARTGDPATRAAAGRALGLIHADPAVAVPALTILFESSDVRLRLAAAEGLTQAMQGLAQAIRRKNGAPGAALRAEALREGRAVVPVVCGGLADPEAGVRSQSIEALRQTALALGRLVAEPRAVARENPTECEAYRREVDAERAELAPLAGDLKDQTVGLTNALGDTNAAVRLHAHQALEELGAAWQRFQARAASVPPLAQVAHVNDGSALDTAGKAGAADFAPKPQQLLVDRLRASLPALMAGLSDPQVTVRRAAVDALETMGDEAAPAAPALFRAFNDPDPFVRWAAARTLGKMRRIDPAPLVPFLARLLSDRDLDVRLAAAEALRRYGPEAQAAVPALVRAMRRGDPDVTLASLRALEGIGPNADAAVPGLAALLVERDARVRTAAAKLLGRFGPDALPVKDQLRAAQADPDAGVRQAVNDALLEILPPVTASTRLPGHSLNTVPGPVPATNSVTWRAAGAPETTPRSAAAGEMGKAYLAAPVIGLETVTWRAASPQAPSGIVPTAAWQKAGAAGPAVAATSGATWAPPPLLAVSPSPPPPGSFPQGVAGQAMDVAPAAAPVRSASATPMVTLLRPVAWSGGTGTPLAR
jgi:hypothetical protein